MFEPKRCTDIDALLPYVRDRVKAVLKDMRSQGYDPIVFEVSRTDYRQLFLYCIGRIFRLASTKVTWTLTSKHQVKKAVDIISRSRGWNHPEFFRALGIAAIKTGLHQSSAEPCHIEWRG